MSAVFGISSFTRAFFSFGGFVSFPAITVGADDSPVILSISMRFIICLAAVTIFVAPAVLSPSTFEATASGRDLDNRATELYPALSIDSAIFDPTPGISLSLIVGLGISSASGLISGSDLAGWSTFLTKSFAAATSFLAPDLLNPSIFFASDGARDLDIFSTESYFAATSFSANFEPTPGSFVIGIPSSETGAGAGFFLGAAFLERFFGFLAVVLAFGLAFFFEAAFLDGVFFFVGVFFPAAFFFGLGLTRSPKVDWTVAGFFLDFFLLIQKHLHLQLLHPILHYPEAYQQPNRNQFHQFQFLLGQLQFQNLRLNLAIYWQ